MATSSCKELSSKSSEEIPESPNLSVIKPLESHKKSHSKDLLNIRTDSFESKLLLKPRKTYKTDPSSVLQSVKDFLPLMSSANQDLAQKLETIPREEFDIENVTVNHTGPIIEMDLRVFQEGSDDESGSDYEVDSENETCNDIVLPCSEVTQDSLKMSINAQRKKRADIVELNTETSNGVIKSISRQ